MQWPPDILQRFASLPFEVATGETPESVARHLLNQSARYAVWRCMTESCSLHDAYRMPYTPLGHLSASGFDGKVRSMRFDDRWVDAIEALYAYARQFSDEILAAFAAERQEYPSDGRA